MTEEKSMKNQEQSIKNAMMIQEAQKTIKKSENLRKSAKIEKFTKNCEKCEKYENRPNFINISLDFIRYFAH